MSLVLIYKMAEILPAFHSRIVLSQIIANNKRNFLMLGHIHPSYNNILYCMVVIQAIQKDILNLGLLHLKINNSITNLFKNCCCLD